jgi:hypothetical protein
MALVRRRLSAKSLTRETPIYLDAEEIEFRVSGYFQVVESN